MRYLLVTGHNVPRFYKLDGSIVDVDLQYVESKTISSIDEHGELNHIVVKDTPYVDDVWMVDSVEESLNRLAREGVYPFINKKAARENAKRLELRTFKYIAVP